MLGSKHWSIDEDHQTPKMMEKFYILHRGGEKDETTKEYEAIEAKEERIPVDSVTAERFNDSARGRIRGEELLGEPGLT